MLKSTILCALALTGRSRTQLVRPLLETFLYTGRITNRDGVVVQAALKYKHIKIVSYDWLEDSLQRRTRCGVHAYLWSKLEHDVKIRKHHEKTEREKLLAEARKCFPHHSTSWRCVLWALTPVTSSWRTGKAAHRMCSATID